MADRIRSLFDATTALSITLAGLAHSATQIGQAGPLVDNETDAFDLIHIYIRIHTHATVAVTANTQASIYLLQADEGASATYLDDGWNGTDTASFQFYNTRPIGAIRIPVTTANTPYYGKFTVRNPGPGWSVGIAQNSGQAFHATPGNLYVRWRGEYKKIEAI